MKPDVTGRKCVPRRHSYTKVRDNRKQPIRGLWRRNGRFMARLRVEDELGHKQLKWFALQAQTAAQAQTELRKLLTDRQDHALRHVGLTPKFSDYVDRYIEALKTSGKKPGTLVTERGHCRRWSESIGHLRLDKIQPHHLTEHLQRLKAAGRSSRTCNLSMVCLRNVLKGAKIDGYLKHQPFADIPWRKVETKSRPLYQGLEIDLFCRAALAATKNGPELVDYLRFMQYAGSREKESLRIRWTDVDFALKQVTVGAEGDTKNRECRRVDMSPALEALLKDMHARRAPDTAWLFPSPQRGDRDAPAKTLRPSLLLTRSVAGCRCGVCCELSFGARLKSCTHCGAGNIQPLEQALPAKLRQLGFHDCRHHFISTCVMSGLDYMTVARWVGHKDGGVLIGRVYGHLSDAHTKSQAAKLTFGIAVLPAANAGA